MVEESSPVLSVGAKKAHYTIPVSVKAILFCPQTTLSVRYTQHTAHKTRYYNTHTKANSTSHSRPPFNHSLNEFIYPKAQLFSKNVDELQQSLVPPTRCCTAEQTCRDNDNDNDNNNDSCIVVCNKNDSTVQ